jgi:hypothetical protein
MALPCAIRRALSRRFAEIRSRSTPAAKKNANVSFSKSSIAKSDRLSFHLAPSDFLGFDT